MSMYYRDDGFFPDYASNVVLTSGGIWIGLPNLLVGCKGLSVQAMGSGGLAGTLYIEGSNFDGYSAIYQPSPVSIAMGANGSAMAVFSPTDQITNMHQMRCRFVASAAGTLNLALNLRR